MATKSLSIKDLSGAVQQAVKTATSKPQVATGHGIHVGPIIMGIILQPQQLPQAERIAAEIAGHVGTSQKATFGGVALEPGVLIRGGQIICGFIAPEVELHE